MALTTTTFFGICRACTRYSGLRLLPSLGAQQERGRKVTVAEEKDLSDGMLKELEGKPKRPPTAFLSWLNDNRQRLGQGGVQMRMTQMSTLGALEWRALGEEEKQLYREQHREQLQQYSAVHKAFMTSLSPQQLQVIKQRAALKRQRNIKAKADKMAVELGKPKRPPSAFLLFTMENQPPQGSPSLTGFMRTCGGQWQMMSKEEKLSYEERARLLMQQYQQSLAEWEDRMKLQGNIHLLRRSILTKEEKLAADAILHPFKKSENPKKKPGKATKTSSKVSKKSTEATKSSMSQKIASTQDIKDMREE